MSFVDRLNDLVSKYEEVGKKLLEPNLTGDEIVKLSKENSNLEPIVNKIKEYQGAEQGLLDCEEMLKEENDSETKKMIEEEIGELRKKLPILKREVELMLLPKDEADEKNAILEIRAGTGGEEASLFGGVLFKMYQRYAEKMGWKFEVMSIDESDLGGVKEASISIKGHNVFKRLKFESGCHRVQRVPETEQKGRVHTSAATVAVLPEAEEVDIKIEDKDLWEQIKNGNDLNGFSVEVAGHLVEKFESEKNETPEDEINKLIDEILEK